jgi:hypothetical protein
LTTSDLFRPAVDIVLNDEFMTCGYMPTTLPLSCLTMAPRFDAKLNSSIIAVSRQGNVLGEVNRVHLPGTAEHPQGSFNTYAQHFVADFDLVTFFLQEKFWRILTNSTMVRMPGQHGLHRLPFTRLDLLPSNYFLTFSNSLPASSAQNLPKSSLL